MSRHRAGSSPGNNDGGCILGSLARKRAKQGYRKGSSTPVFSMAEAAVVNAIIDAIVTTDKLGIITSFNDAAVKMFMYEREEIIGKNVSCLMPSPYRDVHHMFLKSYHKTRQGKLIGVTRQLKGNRKNGVIFPIEISLGEIKADSGAITGFVAVIRDTSKLTAARSKRYAHEYKELEHLGRGNFGAVYKCKNELDGQLYAIKKVHFESLDTMRDAQLLKRRVKEVNVLAKMSPHENIVRYYTSWLEEDDFSEDSVHVIKETSEEMSRKSSLEKTQSRNSSAMGDNSQGGDMVTVSASGDASSFSASQSSLVFSASNGSYSSLDSGALSTGSTNSLSDSIAKKSVLYMVMELCQSATLRDWLDDPKRVIDPKENLHILFQILKGLRHIHKYDCVHRDLKPSNIFISKDGRSVKIGDFGLARDLKTAARVRNNRNEELLAKRALTSPASTNYVSSLPGESTDPVEVEQISKHANKVIFQADEKSVQEWDKPTADIYYRLTTGVGNRLYSAPEQFHKKGARGVADYNSKADMFALGMIFVEMYMTRTDNVTEFVRKLLRSRQALIPEEMWKNHKEEAELVTKLLAADPDTRPSSEELLNHKLFVQFSLTTITPMKNGLFAQQQKIEEKDKIIIGLVEEIREKDIELARLTQQLDQAQEMIRNLKSNTM